MPGLISVFEVVTEIKIGVQDAGDMVKNTASSTGLHGYRVILVNSLFV